MSLPGKTTTEWCAGLPLVETRPLDSRTRQLLQQEEQKYRKRGYGTLALYAIAVGLFILAAVIAPSDPEETKSLLIFAVFILTAVGLPVILLITREFSGRRKSLSQDLTTGIVKHFAGRSGVIPVGDEVWQQMREAHLIPNDLHAEWSMDVLAASGRVWQISGQPIKRWQVVRTVEIATTPAYAAVATQWLQPVESPGPTPLLAGQRAMSPAEREELRRYAGRLWRRPLPTAIALTLWCAFPMASILMKGSLNTTEDWFSFVVLAAFTIANDGWLLKTVQDARKLMQDEKAGYVVMVRATDASPGQPATIVTPGIQAPETDVHEVLVVSRKIWTRGGYPVSWRMVRP